MRQTFIVAATALVVAMVGIWSATAILGNAQRQASAVPASTPVDVMQMMQNAKNLPDQQFDAH